MSAPHRILFVCHGNICRSTMAEFVMKDLVSRRGMAHAFVIGSAATHADPIGPPVPHAPPPVPEAQAIVCSRQTPRRLPAPDPTVYQPSSQSSFPTGVILGASPLVPLGRTQPMRNPWPTAAGA